MKCNKFIEYEIGKTTPVEIIFTDNPPISDKEVKEL